MTKQPGLVDFHNHVLAAVDDGARSDEDGHQALCAFADAGAVAVIATPHIDASLSDFPDRLNERLREIGNAYTDLQDWASRELPELRLELGAEVRLDTPTPDLSDGRLRLAGGRFVLVEFAFSGLPPNAERALGYIVECGYRPIVAHPERYRGFPSDLSLGALWRGVGALLQVNGGSLLGMYGERAQSISRGLLASGMVDYIASDHHARGALPVPSYVAWLRDAGAADQLELLTVVNPGRILEGRDPEPVPEVEFRYETTGFWAGVRARFGARR